MGLLSSLMKKATQPVVKVKLTEKQEETEYERQHERMRTAERLYGAASRKHIENTEKINTMYSVARDLQGFDGEMMEQCIALCWEDIDIAEDVKKYYGMMYGGECGYYGTFTRLAIIYEKRGEFDKAIEVCQQAIACGMDKDSNNTTIHARMARLIKKRNNQLAKLEAGK